MPATDPFSSFVRSLAIRDGFEVGLKALTSFFIKSEDSFDPGELVSSFLANCSDRKQLEFILFCFLDVGKADIDIARLTFSFKRLQRLLGRMALGYEVSPGESDLVNELCSAIGISSVPEFHTIVDRVPEQFLHILKNEEPGDKVRQGINALILAESRALQERIEWLSSNADAYNMNAMRRLIPFLTICDERMKSQRELGDAIVKKTPVGLPVLSFEYRMHDNAFAKWLKKLEKIEELNSFTTMIRLQKQKLVPVHYLVAVTTVIRWLIERKQQCHPVEWIIKALECCTHEGFRIDTEDGLSSIDSLLSMSGAQIYGTVIEGKFTELNSAKWIGPDLLTKARNQSEPTIREMITASLQSERMLMSLLDNPRVYSTPGMVEHIVKVTKSMTVLLKIASSRQLYAGEANRGVPTALMRNPCQIPLTILRGFMHPLYVTLADMRDMLKNQYGMRREVISELERCVGVKR